jgi:hypothetical protein
MSESNLTKLINELHDKHKKREKNLNNEIYRELKQLTTPNKTTKNFHYNKTWKNGLDDKQKEIYYSMEPKKDPKKKQKQKKIIGKYMAINEPQVMNRLSHIKAERRNRTAMMQKKKTELLKKKQEQARSMKKKLNEDSKNAKSRRLEENANKRRKIKQLREAENRSIIPLEGKPNVTGLENKYENELNYSAFDRTLTASQLVDPPELVGYNSNFEEGMNDDNNKTFNGFNDENNPKYSAEELKNQGYSAEELKNQGYSAEELIKAGYSDQDLKEAGFSAKELRDAGIHVQGGKRRTRRRVKRQQDK